MAELVLEATKHLKDIFEHAIKMEPGEETLVIFDSQAPLSRIMTDAYRANLPSAIFLNFDTLTPPDILRAIEARKAGDLVVLVQSTNFRLNEFRIRVELFKRNLKTMEHVHLGRMSEEQFPIYIEALAYDPDYYRPQGQGLKAILDQTQDILVECAGTKLIYKSPMEEAKLNIGDYTNMKNIGGTFPIGEVFTEPKDLRAVNGEVMIFAFATDDHYMKTFPPFRAQIKDGIFSAPEGPVELQSILNNIQKDEEVLVREFGLGLNQAMGKNKMLNDVTAFERQKGLHLSLGAKHTVYAKPGLSRKHGRYHVDVFVDVKQIWADGRCFFQDGLFYY